MAATVPLLSALLIVYMNKTTMISFDSLNQQKQELGAPASVAGLALSDLDWSSLLVDTIKMLLQFKDELAMQQQIVNAYCCHAEAGNQGMKL